MSDQVLSWQVTSDQLAEWGFPVEKTDHCVGSKVIVSEGMSWGKAVHAAWAAGHVRIAVIPESVVAERRARFFAGHEEMRRTAQENLEHLRRHGLIVGPSHR